MPTGLDSGNSDFYSLIYRWSGSKFEPFQKLPSHGGRDFKFFRIGEKPYLALTNLRSGQGPCNVNTYSTLYVWDGAVSRSDIYQWNGKQFDLFQSVKAKKARDITHFRIDHTDYLAVSNAHKNKTSFKVDSVIYEAK